MRNAESGLQTGRAATAVHLAGRRRRAAASRQTASVSTPASPPFRLASRQQGRATTVIVAGDVAIGAGDLVVIAGPCSVESRQQIRETARRVKAAGARMLRGGAYKPRTSPYEFQGLGKKALEWLVEAREESGLPVVTEVLSVEDVDMVSDYADMLQVGARNMQNYALLRRLATAPKPVLLKRGPAATIREWLLAAEYLLSGGNPNVVLCERGIRTFETATRNTLDLAGAALVKELSHLPVLVDPSHGTGQRRLVPPASRAAAAIGADGLMIEVHPRPDEAWSDGEQSLDPAQFSILMNDLRSMIPACGVRMPGPKGQARQQISFSSVISSMA
ncbi:MAG TPA: 3-deoxy-7-phosphoheptulonate synthase [Terriglobia bacterium]|nr:3-deoxy-7-phosphoheptulonate synthase [Terriglobia bacterium]